MRRLTVLTLLAGLVLGACSPDNTAESTSTSSRSSTSTTSTPSTSTTLASATTTTPPTTTTTAATTTTLNPPPGKVTAVSAGLSGGSGEIFVSWDASPAPDLSHYNIYFSVDPGASKAFLVALPGDETDYIDFPRDLTEGINCYQISAVDDEGNEGALSDEACFSAS